MKKKFSECSPSTRDAMARRGDLLCDKCENSMDMYYQPWCPTCEPPNFKKLEVINLIQVLTHLETKGHDGIKDRVWDFYIDSIRNDSYFHASFHETDELTEDEKVLKSFLQRDSVLFEVSW